MQPTIKHMLEFGHPIRVVEKEGLLIPVYLIEKDDTELENLQTTSVEKAAEILTRQFNFEPFRFENFTRFKQSRIHHANCTQELSDLTQRHFSMADSEKFYRFIKNIFYYAPQSDAIAYRQGWYKNEKEMILYQPRIVEFKEIESQEEKEPVYKGTFKIFGEEISIFEKEDKRPFFFTDEKGIHTMELDLFIPRNVSLHKTKQEREIF